MQETLNFTYWYFYLFFFQVFYDSYDDYFDDVDYEDDNDTSTTQAPAPKVTNLIGDQQAQKNQVLTNSVDSNADAINIH